MMEFVTDTNLTTDFLRMEKWDIIRLAELLMLTSRRWLLLFCFVLFSRRRRWTHVLALHLAPSPLQGKGFWILPAIDFFAFDWILLIWMVMYLHRKQKGSCPMLESGSLYPHPDPHSSVLVIAWNSFDFGPLKSNMQLFVTWSQLEFPRHPKFTDPVTLKAITGKHEY